MFAIITIELKGMRLSGNHGLYTEESKLGNEFVLDLEITYRTRKKIITEVQDTIDYVQVYKIVATEFQNRENILETCAIKIANRLHAEFQKIIKIQIRIKKLAPPITNFTGSVGVTYTKSFK
jgi:dihydroneopterin aldolase